MAYDRIIKHYGPTPATFIQDLSSRSGPFWFELLRKGGCGQGQLHLKDVWSLRNSVSVGDWITAEYSSGDRWYLGRVEEVQNDDPAGTTLSLYGMSAQLSEVFPGGFGDANGDSPHLYTRSDYVPNEVRPFHNDPDRDLHTIDYMSSPGALVALLHSGYIAPATNIGTGRMDLFSEMSFDTALFRGEESALSILQSLSMFARSASFGVDEDGDLYFIGKTKHDPVVGTFQEGVNCQKIQRRRDRSLLFNRLLLTGSHVYRDNIILSGLDPDNLAGWTGFYKYRAMFHVQASIDRHGERRMRLAVPWVRSHADARLFATEFFREYGKVTDQYSVTTMPVTTLPRPWDGQMELRAVDGTLLRKSAFDRLRVNFNHSPTLEIVLGPEEPQFAEEEGLDDRYESGLPAERPPPPSITSQPTFSTITGTSSMSSFSSSFSSSFVSCCSCNFYFDAFTAPDGTDVFLDVQSGPGAPFTTLNNTITWTTGFYIAKTIGILDAGYDICVQATIVSVGDLDATCGVRITDNEHPPGPSETFCGFIIRRAAGNFGLTVVSAGVSESFETFGAWANGDVLTMRIIDTGSTRTVECCQNGTLIHTKTGLSWNITTPLSAHAGLSHTSSGSGTTKTYFDNLCISTN